MGYTGLEPASSVWKTDMLTIAPIPHFLEEHTGFEPVTSARREDVLPLHQCSILFLEEHTGLEPASSAWRADMLTIYTNAPYFVVKHVGIEPAASAWQADMLTITPMLHIFSGRAYRIRTDNLRTAGGYVTITPMLHIFLEEHTGLEPASSAWRADMLTIYTNAPCVGSWGAMLLRSAPRELSVILSLCLCSFILPLKSLLIVEKTLRTSLCDSACFVGSKTFRLLPNR